MAEISNKERMELEQLREQKRKLAERTARYGERQRARVAILVAKARKAGITVSDEEVEKYLKAK